MSMAKQCTKAIIPVAGYGSRRLPIVKAIDKCMLPILNRPLIDFVIQDCIKAGIKDIYVVVSKGGGKQIADYYAKNEPLEQYLVVQHKEQLLPLVAPLRSDVQLHFVEQDTTTSKYGTTIPVALCAQYIEPDEQVLVIMGDQTLYRLDGGSEAVDLIAATAAAGMTAGLIGVPVPKETVSQYGIIDKTPDGTYAGIIEHPTIEEAPSNLNNASFYLFDHELMQLISAAAASDPSQEGEYMIIHQINDYVKGGKQLFVLDAKGEYLDCGNVENWLAANQFVAEHPVLS